MLQINMKDKKRKVFLEIKLKDYTRFLAGDYHPEIRGTYDIAPENSYVDNIQIYKFQNTIDVEATNLLEALFEIQPGLETTLKQLLEDEAEKTID